MARKTALEILLKYQKEGSYLNITLHDVLLRSNLSRQDKDLVTTIVYGTVQNKLYLQYLMEPFIKVKLKLQEQMILLCPTLYCYVLHLKQCSDLVVSYQ